LATEGPAGVDRMPPERFISVRDPTADPHLNGEYLKKNPTWHVEFSAAKAKNILALMARTLRVDGLVNKRDRHSHRHHFNKETALRVLEEVEYEIVDYRYPPIDVTPRTRSKLAKPIRAMFFNWNPDLTARVLGGFSLLVLTR
jgi:hypothetical protein